MSIAGVVLRSGAVRRAELEEAGKIWVVAISAIIAASQRAY
jgi:hypothetical protein